MSKDAQVSPVGSSVTSEGRPKRQDIEGLRIVAVGLVMVYHFANAGVSGGVDVFLFISGFFVLGGLLRRVVRRKPLEIRSFYTRTAKRLLPAAWVTIVLTFVGIILLAPRSYWLDRLEHGFASLLYGENLHLISQQSVYGADHSHLNPYQHFWSLSVQGQIFLAAPLVIGCLSLAMRRVSDRFRHIGVIAVVAAFTTLATVISWSLTSANQSTAYFSTVARLWEFLAGALVALLVIKLQLPAWLRVPLGWVGAGLLLSGGFITNGAQTFPGPQALVPIGGAILIIVAGTSPTRIGVDRVLSWRPLAYCGRYSYGLYLWHWAIMSLYLISQQRLELRLREAVVLAAISMLFAVVTHHLVENPTRTLGAWRSWLAPKVIPVVAVCIIGATSMFLVRADLIAEQEKYSTYEADPIEHPGAMAIFSDGDLTRTYELPPVPHPLAKDQESVVSGSGVSEDEAGTVVVCDPMATPVEPGCKPGDLINEGDGEFKISIVGGSHTDQWLYALGTFLRDHDYSGTRYARSWCPAAVGRVPGDNRYEGSDMADDCVRWNAMVLDQILEDRPDLVITLLSTTQTTDSTLESIPEAFMEFNRTLSDAGIQVLAIRDNPRIPQTTLDCVDEMLITGKECDYRLAKSGVHGDLSTLINRDLPELLSVADLSGLWCVDNECPVILGNTVVYQDPTHFSTEYILSMTPMFHQLLEAVIGLERTDSANYICEATYTRSTKTTPVYEVCSSS